VSGHWRCSGCSPSQAGIGADSSLRMSLVFGRVCRYMVRLRALHPQAVGAREG